ncbi:MAG: HAD family phosphatase [Clostridiales bacterium]|jgi:HAD superfamily hydrolase (TIGR01509 family)|nr:HAD family phosphatase [Clostridiales bacterium]
MKSFILPKLVIFDMDGTMLDTEIIAFDATTYAGNEMGIEIKKEIVESLMGKNKAGCIEVLRTNLGDDFDIEKLFRISGAYMNNYFEKNGVPVKPGVFEILDKLEKLGIKKCVATSTTKASATRKLTSANLAHRFEVIIGGDEIENGKPAPDIFLKAAAHCNTDPEDCIVIEDTEAGVLAATSAGIRVVIVPDIAPLCDEIRAKGFVCESLFEVAEKIF